MSDLRFARPSTGCACPGTCPWHPDYVLDAEAGTAPTATVSEMLPWAVVWAEIRAGLERRAVDALRRGDVEGAAEVLCLLADGYGVLPELSAVATEVLDE
jgi:hypothetical protein